MRWLVLAPYLAATGCNWIYGLEKTELVDAAPPSELPPGLRTKLVWAIPTTDGMPAAPGIDPVLEYKPIGSETQRPQLPLIQVGDDTGLMDAAYDLADGTFEIPYSLRESPHRIVYTLPGESVPNEVQWSLTNAFLVVPRLTRFDAPSPPANSGYTITPTGLVGSLLTPTLITSGTFTYSNNGSAFTQSAGAITFPFAQYGAPVFGPLGAPQATRGDWVLLGDMRSRTAQQLSFTGWALTSVDLAANMMSVPATQPAWMTGDRSLSTIACMNGPTDCIPSANPSQTQGRLDTVLGAGTPGRYLAYGISPSIELPGFLPGVAPLYVERPLVLPFLESNQIDSLLTVADPSSALAFDRVITMRVSSARVADGVTLTSSIQAITNVFSGSLTFPAPLARNVMLGATNLSAADSMTVPASSGVQKLRFDPEAGFKADDYVITLYELTGTSLAPVRIYHVLAPEAKIDGNLLVGGHHYVFGITARSGFPGADRGDFGKAAYPFGSTTTFARTFMVQ